MKQIGLPPIVPKSNGIVCKMRASRISCSKRVCHKKSQSLEFEGHMTKIEMLENILRVFFLAKIECHIKLVSKPTKSVQEWFRSRARSSSVCAFNFQSAFHSHGQSQIFRCICSLIAFFISFSLHPESWIRENAQFDTIQDEMELQTNKQKERIFDEKKGKNVRSTKRNHIILYVFTKYF